jgi:hypothetical protein
MRRELNRRLLRVEELLNQAARRDERGELDRVICAAIVVVTLDFLSRRILGLPQIYDLELVQWLAEDLGEVEAFRAEAHRRARAIRIWLALEDESPTELRWWRIVATAERIRMQGPETQIETELLKVVFPWNEERRREETLVQLLLEWIRQCRAELIDRKKGR